MALLVDSSLPTRGGQWFRPATLLGFCLLACLGFGCCADLTSAQQPQLRSKEKTSHCPVTVERDYSTHTSWNMCDALSDEVGPRLTASPESEKAAHRAALQLTEIGISNPREESWGTFGIGWTVPTITDDESLSQWRGKLKNRVALNSAPPPIQTKPAPSVFAVDAHGRP